MPRIQTRQRRNTSFCSLVLLFLYNGLRRRDVLARGREQQVEVQLGILALGALVGLKVDNEIVLDGKDGVGSEPGVVFGVDLGDDGLVVVVGDLQKLC